MGCGRIAVVFVIALNLFAARNTVHAATFTCAAGDVSCLITSIATANATPEPDIIQLAAGSYSLTDVQSYADGWTGLPSVTGTLSLVGAGRDVTGIGRDNAAGRFRLLHVAATGNLTLRDLTLHGGEPPDNDPSELGADGGALINKGGTVTIIDCTVTDNHTRYGKGAAIRNLGTLFLANSTVSNNDASVGRGAGGIFNTGSLSIANTLLYGNWNYGGAGAIGNLGGTVTIDTSTLRDNHAGEDLKGGGIANVGGTVTITRSALHHNWGDRGGAIFNAGIITIADSTIGHNVGIEGGAAIENDGGTVMLTNATVSRNTSFADFSWSAAINNSRGSVRLQNAVVALNTSDRMGGNSAFFWDCGGPVTSLGNNLIGALDGCTLGLSPSDLIGDPGLDSFVENGPPGNGHFPLLSTSTLIDAGNDSACSTVDQLGHPRVGHCDIGAVEYQPASLSVAIAVHRGESDTASLNPRRRGTIPVVILSDGTFSAADVDPSTVRFGKTGTEAAAVRFTLEDVNSDNAADVVFFFRMPETGFACGDTQAHLRGGTLAGQLIHGSEAIVTVGCQKRLTFSSK